MAGFISVHSAAALQSRSFTEGLEGARPVVEVPVPPGIVEAAGKTIRFIVQGRIQRVGIGSGKCGPVRWHVEKFQRSIVSNVPSVEVRKQSTLKRIGWSRET